MWGALVATVTMVPRQVREGQWLTADPVCEPLQEDIDRHRLRDLQVLVGRRLEHNGDLPVHIGLGEVSSAFPGGCTEHHGDVLWEGGVGMAAESRQQTR
jgi:hypothetical protein